MRLSLIVACTVTLAACASASTTPAQTPAPVCTVDGAYSVSITPGAGDCGAPATQQTSTWLIVTELDGGLSTIVPGGATILTLNASDATCTADFSWTRTETRCARPDSGDAAFVFTPDGFTATLTFDGCYDEAIAISKPAGCTGTFSVTGVRQR
jgi:hypothetical protein